MGQKIKNEFNFESIGPGDLYVEGL